MPDQETGTQDKNAIEAAWMTGATNYADILAAEEAEERSNKIRELAGAFPEIVYNIFNTPMITDKASAIESAAGELADLVRDEASAKEVGMDAQSAQEDLSLWVGKETDDLYWLAVYSNNYRDDDQPPEIISADAHRNFVKAVDGGEWPMPELWYWHVPGTHFGDTRFVAYDEDSGMSVAGGVIFPEFADVANEIKARGDHRVSHGMPPGEVKRDPSDPTIITRYRSAEISLLPEVAAANKRTFQIIKEGMRMDEKGIPEAKKAEMAALGFDPDAIEAGMQAEAETAEGEGRDAKEIKTEAPVEPVAVEPAPVEPAVDAVTEPTGEATAEPIGDPAPDAGMVMLAEAIAGAMQPIVDQLGELEGRVKALTEKETPEPETTKEADGLDEFTPAASLGAMIRSRVVGLKETQIDGRSARHQGPAEAPKTKATMGKESSLPIPWLNSMLENGDWRQGFEGQDD